MVKIAKITATSFEDLKKQLKDVPDHYWYVKTIIKLDDGGYEAILVRK